jgi:hypothetical protein
MRDKGTVPLRGVFEVFTVIFLVAIMQIYIFSIE